MAGGGRGGALRPGDGYVVGWPSPDEVRQSGRSRPPVVAAPAQAYYLDMAADDDWREPGASWAGPPPSTPRPLRPPRSPAGPPDERARLPGIQACLWSEHVHDRADVARVLLPRLDVFAASAWTSEFRF